MELRKDKTMINNLKIIEDNDDSIIGKKFGAERHSMSVNFMEFKGHIFTDFSITKIHRWKDKWALEKEIECEERCQRLFG